MQLIYCNFYPHSDTIQKKYCVIRKKKILQKECKCGFKRITFEKMG